MEDKIKIPTKEVAIAKFPFLAKVDKMLAIELLLNFTMMSLAQDKTFFEALSAIAIGKKENSTAI